MPFSDYGNIIIEIDKLVRSDRDKLHGNVYTRDNGGPITHQYGSLKHGLAVKSTNSIELQLDLDQNQRKPLVHVGGSATFQTSLGSLIGEPEPRVECAAQKDMRQVRLFKTRFCSYGSDCPYLLRGKCLYAHNRDEIRFRPPPPASYKIPKQPLKTSVSPRSSKSVWALPENTPSDCGDSSPQNKISSNTVESFSLFDCMPPRTSTTVNFSDFPSL